MNVLPTLFAIGMFVSLYFAARPPAGHTKWHGLLGVFVCLVMAGVTAPKRVAPPESATGTERAAKSASEPEERSVTSGDPYASELKQYAWIPVSKGALKQKLKDPESAQFRNVRFYSGGGIPVVCGEVNARNSFGGYSGYERFIAAGSTMAYLESEVSDGLGPVWAKMCRKAPHDAAYER